MKLYELAGEDLEIRFSPYCWIVRFALVHKGLHADLIPWHMTDKEAIAFSGQGKVPLLVDGSNVIADSVEILAYLEKNHVENPLGLSGEYMFIRKWSEGILHELMVPLLHLPASKVMSKDDEVYFRDSIQEYRGKSLEELFENPEDKLQLLREGIAPLRNTLEQQQFLGGDHPSASDYTVMGWFMWARCVSECSLLEKDDAVYRWRERMLELFGGMGKNVKSPYG